MNLKEILFERYRLEQQPISVMRALLWRTSETMRLRDNIDPFTLECLGVMCARLTSIEKSQQGILGVWGEDRPAGRTARAATVSFGYLLQAATGAAAERYGDPRLVKTTHHLNPRLMEGTDEATAMAAYSAVVAVRECVESFYEADLRTDASAQ